MKESDRSSLFHLKSCSERFTTAARMRIDDLLRSARQFALTCIVVILINSERRASGDLHQEPPRFKIGEKVALETTLSCGIGMFENKQDSVTQCASMNEGRNSLLLFLQSLISKFAINNNELFYKLTK